MMVVLVISVLIYETKEFFIAGGFSNQIACSLYKMNLSVIFAYLLPEDLKPVMRLFKFILSQFNGHSPDGAAGTKQLDRLFPELRRRRSRSKTRISDFTNLDGFSTQ